MTSVPHETAREDGYLPADTALLSVCAHARFWVCAVVGVGVDLWSKQWAFSHVDHRGQPFIPGFISFIPSLNEGALFGLGKGLQGVFIVASVAAFGFVLYLFSQSSCRRWSVHLALGMILGGAMGNLYDRALYGRVRDFIKFEPEIAGYDVWPWVFNVADALLVVGVAVLLVNLWLDKRLAEAAAAERETEETDRDA
jgi:signal peptidase II